VPGKAPLALVALPPAVPAFAADGAARFAAAPFHDCADPICFEASVDGRAPRTLALDTGDIDSAMPTDAAKAMIRQPGPVLRVAVGHRGPPSAVGAPFTIDGHPAHARIDTTHTGTTAVYDAPLGGPGLRKQGVPKLFDFTYGDIEMPASPARSLGFVGHRLPGASPTAYFAGSGKNPVHQPDGLFEATVGNPLFAHSAVTMDFHAVTLDARPADGPRAPFDLEAA
jgi:hypothetical protein